MAILSTSGFDARDVDAQLLLATGNPEEAAEIATRSLALAQSQKKRGHESTLIVSLVTCLRAAIATALGMRPLVAPCHFGLSTLYRPYGYS